MSQPGNRLLEAVAAIKLGAYTLSPQGKKVRAFTDREGGLTAAQKWADFCNEHFLKGR